MCGASVFVHGGHYFSVSKISELLTVCGFENVTRDFILKMVINKQRKRNFGTNCRHHKTLQ